MHSTAVRVLAAFAFVLAMLLPAANVASARGGGGGGGRGGAGMSGGGMAAGARSGGSWQGGAGHSGSWHSGHSGHHHRHGSTVFFGGAFFWSPWWWSPWAFYPPYYSTVVVSEPPVFIQGPSGDQATPGFWYFCQSARGYYPDVQTCPEDWIRVPPRSP
jgi:hypothetical protein